MSLIEHHAMKTCWEVELHLHTFLTSTVDGGERSASRCSHFNLWKKNGTHWIGRMGPRALAKRKNSLHFRLCLLRKWNRTIWLPGVVWHVQPVSEWWFLNILRWYRKLKKKLKISNTLR